MISVAFQPDPARRPGPLNIHQRSLFKPVHGSIRSLNERYFHLLFRHESKKNCQQIKETIKESHRTSKMGIWLIGDITETPCEERKKKIVQRERDRENE